MTFKRWLKYQRETFCTIRVAVCVALVLIIANNIKLPPDIIPIVYYPQLDAIATTTPFAILVRDKQPSDYVLAHEKCHVLQANHYGSLWVVVINHHYLQKYGYINNPLEIQARELSGFCNVLETN